MHNDTENTLFQTVKEAYTYTYPIMGMYALLSDQILDPQTRTTNFYEYSHNSDIADPKTTFVPAPNNDTTYSRAWLDLRQEPAILEIPDTGGRFYSIQLLDLFSETIVNVGKRLNGTAAQVHAVVGPDWNGDLPEGIPVIRSNTSLALAFLRVLVENKQDIGQVRRLQAQFKITPLGSYVNQKAPSLSTERFHGNLPTFDTSSYLQYFVTMNRLFSLLPQLPEDQEILNRFAAVGIGKGKTEADLNQIHETVLTAACDEARKQIDEKGLEFGESVNYWRIARDKIGNYGTDYLQRAVVWFKGALANQPEESLYPSVFQDSTGELLDGRFRYQLHFEKDQLPPVSQFWSLTLYLFSNGFLTENKIDRYSVGDRTEHLAYDKDGGLTICIQHSEPDDSSQRANWLPAPEDKFYMTLRLYGPDQTVIDGVWNPPSVRRLG